jgi:acetyltransferase-like isoleucine patch superfamily enzyme
VLAVRSLRTRLRFTLWRLLASAKLRRTGTRLVIERGKDVRFGNRPRFEVTRIRSPAGALDATGGELVVRLGDRVDLGRDTVIEYVPGARSEIALGEGTYLTSQVRLCALGGTIAIGSYSRLRDWAIVKSSGWLGGGERTYVQEGAHIFCASEIVLESHVTISERAAVHDSDHDVSGDEVWHLARPVITSPVHIGYNTIVSGGATVLKGVRLGRNAVVGAGAVVVAGEYPDGWLVAGVPARAVKALGEPMEASRPPRGEGSPAAVHARPPSASE